VKCGDLDQLFVEGLDDEQIWQQIQLRVPFFFILIFIHQEYRIIFIFARTNGRI
jgi:hypothetical protein